MAPAALDLGGQGPHGVAQRPGLVASDAASAARRVGRLVGISTDDRIPVRRRRRRRVAAARRETGYLSLAGEPWRGGRVAAPLTARLNPPRYGLVPSVVVTVLPLPPRMDDEVPLAELRSPPRIEERSALAVLY
jgi:hypothetical protein